MDEFGATLTEATLGLTLFGASSALAAQLTLSARLLHRGPSSVRLCRLTRQTLVLTPITMRPATGRRDVYVISFLLYGLFLIGSAGVRNLPGFLVFRLLSVCWRLIDSSDATGSGRLAWRFDGRRVA